MIRVVRGTVDENAEEAWRPDPAAPRRSSSSTTTSRSRNAMDSSASEAASRVRTAMRVPRFRPTCVSSKSDAWDRILRGRRTASRLRSKTCVGPARGMAPRARRPTSTIPRLRRAPRRGALARRRRLLLVHASHQLLQELLHLGVREVLRRPLRYLVLRHASLEAHHRSRCGRVGRRRM